MIQLIQKISIGFAALLLAFLSYQGFVKDSSKEWKNFQEPQLAAFTSLEQDQEILQELERQTHFSTYKPLDPAFFVKPHIFQTIDR